MCRKCMNYACMQQFSTVSCIHILQTMQRYTNMQTMYEVCLHACLLHHILYTYICVGACNEHLCLHAMRLQLSLERDSLISVGGAHTCHSCSLFFSTAVWASSGRYSHVSGSACRYSLVSGSPYFLQILVWASSGSLKKKGDEQ